MADKLRNDTYSETTKALVIKMNKNFKLFIVFSVGFVFGATLFCYFQGEYDKKQALALYLLGAKEYEIGNFEYSAALLNNAIAKKH